MVHFLLRRLVWSKGTKYGVIQDVGTLEMVLISDHCWDDGSP